MGPISCFFSSALNHLIGKTETGGTRDPFPAEKPRRKAREQGKSSPPGTFSYQGD